MVLNSSKTHSYNFHFYLLWNNFVKQFFNVECTQFIIDQAAGEQVQLQSLSKYNQIVVEYIKKPLCPRVTKAAAMTLNVAGVQLHTLYWKQNCNSGLHFQIVLHFCTEGSCLFMAIKVRYDGPIKVFCCLLLLLKMYVHTYLYYILLLQQASSSTVGF